MNLGLIQINMLNYVKSEKAGRERGICPRAPAELGAPKGVQ